MMPEMELQPQRSWLNLSSTVGLKNVTAGANPMDLKRGIDKAVAEVVKNLEKQKEAVGENYDKIRQVARISPTVMTISEH